MVTATFPATAGAFLDAEGQVSHVPRLGSGYLLDRLICLYKKVFLSHEVFSKENTSFLVCPEEIYIDQAHLNPTCSLGKINHIPSTYSMKPGLFQSLPAFLYGYPLQKKKRSIIPKCP